MHLFDVSHPTVYVVPHPIHLLSYVSQLFLNENVSYKRRRENQNTYFKFNNFFFENRTVYEIMWKNFVQPRRPLAHCKLDT